MFNSSNSMNSKRHPKKRFVFHCCLTFSLELPPSPPYLTQLVPGAERDTEAAAKVVRVDVWLRSVFHIDLNRGEQESRLALLHVCRQQARCLRVLAGGQSLGSS